MNAGSMARLRAFVGIRLPEPLAGGCAALQRDLRSLARVKWLERQNLHLTLKFLGTIQRERVPLLCSLLARAASAAAPALLTPTRVTAFPSERTARVIVVELSDPSGAVLRLQQALERELAAIGVPPEERAFRTHLTLGRLKQGKADARPALAAASLPEGEWRVDGFELIESRLGPTGPSYATLESFGMGRGATTPG